MNKGKKIISTLAIASMLAGNVLPLTSLAATVGVQSGVYTVGENKYVGFRINKDSKSTKLTAKDVADKLGVSVNNMAETAEVVTGTKVTTSKGDYTVVLYGDVTGDGLVNMNDASAIARHVVHLDTLTGEKLEAADVGANDAKVDMNDASRIARYVVNLEDYVIDAVPNDPEQEVPGDGNFTVTPISKYVNNKNVGAVETSLYIKTELETSKR